MVKIVSGMSPQQGLEAYLAGGDQQLKIHALKQQEEQASAERRDKLTIAMAKHKEEQAKALADVNARAAMGDVQALRQQDMEAAANDLPPDEKRRLEYAKLRSDPRIAGNEDALRELDEGFTNLEKGIQDSRRKKAAMSMIETAVKDGVADKAEAEQRLAAGEEPEQLGMEYAKATQQKRKETMALEKSGKAIQRARALLDSIPEDSDDYDQALEVITALEQSPTAQANPNAGKVMLDLVQRLASKENSREFKENAAKEPRPLLGNWAGSWGGPMVGGPDMPPAPPPTSRTHATLRGLASGKIKGKLAAEKERRYPGSAAPKTGTPKPQDLANLVLGLLPEVEDDLDLAKKLKAQGLALTPENAAIVKQALDAMEQNAAQQSGADR